MFERIPEELKALPQWVCVYNDSKVPMKPWEREAASSSLPDTWGTFESACTAVERNCYDNIGFVFHDNGIVGIDVDVGFDEDGLITPLAADIIGKCKSYTEKSRSGRGFHILVKGSLPFKGKNNLNGVEIYKDARYFIMTGAVVLFDSLVESQEAIDYVVATYFKEAPRSHENALKNKIYIPSWELPENGRMKVRPVYPRIPDGCRNICLTSLAGMLHNQGYSKDQIYRELLYANRVACDPSLPVSEIQAITSSVTRYKR